MCIRDRSRAYLLEEITKQTEKFAEEHGFEGFYWLDLLSAVIERLSDREMARGMADALARLDPVLGPRSRLARERRTDVPPKAAL